MFVRLLATLGALAPYLLAFFVGCFGTFLWFRSVFLVPLDRNAKPRSFLVESGWNPQVIARKLESQGFVKHWWSVYLVNKLRSARSNSPTIISSGEYLLSPSMSAVEILDALIKGDIVTHDLTIPPGTTLAEIPAIMEATTLVTALEVEAALNDPVFLASLNIRGSLEGYLFPETYKFSRPITAQEMIRRVVTEGEKARTPEMVNRAAELGMSFHEILTLASIIEKETRHADERPLVSSVFHNRLQTGMPLQADPTVIYGLKNFDGNLTREHLNTPSPYNTYLNTGLPPTPICNPSLESIRAALYPAETEYLYFVADGQGRHVFATRYREHQANVEKYQKVKNERPVP